MNSEETETPSRLDRSITSNDPQRALRNLLQIERLCIARHHRRRRRSLLLDQHLIQQLVTRDEESDELLEGVRSSALEKPRSVLVVDGFGREDPVAGEVAGKVVEEVVAGEREVLGTGVREDHAGERGVEGIARYRVDDLQTVE